jgi:benzoate-CoA ligase
MAETTAMDPQGEVFNFAQYLLDCNTGHAARLAYVDDQRELRYGQLAHQVQAVAAALQASGVRRD